jgi:predicted  nucleic acid-binding Zn-ribbon protein
MAQARTQSNAMLYALVTFVALFVVGIVLAVIFYVKSEEYRTQLNNNKTETAKIASPQEQGALGKIIGKVESPKSYLGTLNGYFNKLVSTVTGTVSADDISAEVKFNDIQTQINKLNESLGQDVSASVGPDSISLLKQIADLKAKLDEARAQMNTLSTQQQQLQGEIKTVKEESGFKEQQLIAQVKQHQDNANEIQTKYDELKNQMAAAAEEQVGAVKKQLEQKQDDLKNKEMQLTSAKDELSQTRQSLKDAIAKLDEIHRPPDKNVAAYQRDAGILRVDLQNGLVFLDIGSENHVYRGLTFTIYDRNMPIPEDKKGKAEIEVFQVDPRVSVARVINPDIKNPIVKEDLVVNLIWDSKTSNRFVVIGDFDFNDDGRIDSDGTRRIQERIERWGGIIEKDVNINTDFVVAGQAPHPLSKPEQAQLDIDPTLQQKYAASLKAVEDYNAAMAKVGELSVPIFNQKQFLYLIGYDALLETASAK